MQSTRAIWVSLAAPLHRCSEPALRCAWGHWLPPAKPGWGRSKKRGRLLCAESPADLVGWFGEPSCAPFLKRAGPWDFTASLSTLRYVKHSPCGCVAACWTGDERSETQTPPESHLGASQELRPELRRSIWIQLLLKVGGGRVWKQGREGKEKICAVFPKETKMLKQHFHEAEWPGKRWEGGLFDCQTGESGRKLNTGVPKDRENVLPAEAGSCRRGTQQRWPGDPERH